VEGRCVEDRDGAVRGLDQQWNLGAAQDDPFGTPTFREFSGNFSYKILTHIWPELRANAGLAFHRIDVRI